MITALATAAAIAADKARKSDYCVRPIAHADAAALVARWHYSGGTSNTAVHCHGLFRAADGALVGCAMWLPPTKVAAQSVAQDWQAVLALTRLVVAPGEPTNAASLLLGASIRMVRRDRRWRVLLTYADTRQGHTGAIYRATNWTYVGEVKGGAAWIDPRTGGQVSQKATTTRTVAQMLAAGYERLPPSNKHKFIMELRRP